MDTNLIVVKHPIIFKWSYDHPHVLDNNLFLVPKGL